MQTLKHWNIKVKTTYGIRDFLEEEGSKLEYVPGIEKNQWFWEVWAVDAAGGREKVFAPKSGKPRRFKSAGALVAFHYRIFGSAKGVFVPFPNRDTT